MARVRHCQDFICGSGSLGGEGKGGGREVGEEEEEGGRVRKDLAASFNSSRARASSWRDAWRRAARVKMSGW